MERIYVDHAATSPIHPKVVDRMVTVMESCFGNPSSIHSFGREARQVLDEARCVLAKSIGASANEIILTSGGTESDNHAIFGVAEAYKTEGNHIITTKIEHHAVLHACQELEKMGFDVTYLPVDETGEVRVEDVRKALKPTTILVSVMYGNNEVGTLQPIKEIGELLQEHPAKFHCDAVQAYGVERLDVKELNVDLLSVSAHKLNGPRGIGFLYAKKDVKIPARLFGGEQERKRRAGTENVSAAAAFQEAVLIAEEEMERRRKTYQLYKEKLIDIFSRHEIDFYINGSLEKSLPHIINFSFPNTNVEAMLVNLDLAGIAVSSGSACTAGSIDPSHVLVAMYGRKSERTKNSLRFSFGLNNTIEQMEKVGAETVKVIQRLTNRLS